EHSQILKRLPSKEKASPEDCLRQLAETLESARGYVRTITGTQDIDAALRIALPHQEEQGNIIYHLLVRTDG
ncbi:MAG: hypothetical protein D3906_14490, partial [Candidatus Electrothrix sp. AUS1_2]|nr:hypothetical protein [Candidatus Electrothrix sp. AUS1_2]